MKTRMGWRLSKQDYLKERSRHHEWMVNNQMPDVRKEVQLRG